MLAVAVFAVAGYLLVARDAGPLPGAGPASGGGRSAGPVVTPKGASAAPSYYVEVPSEESFRPINDRSADRRPLTVSAVFAGTAENPRYGGVQLVLRGSRVDGCPAAVWGKRLKQTLRRNGCNQVLRGRYVDREGRIVGMVAILNMKDVEGATAVIDALDPRYGAGFVRPLSDPDDPYGVGRGYSEAHAHAMGHYVFVRWAQRVDGSRPDPAVGSDISRAAVALTDAQWAIRQRVLAVTSSRRR